MLRPSSIRLRRDVSADWAAKNPVLSPGEPGIELDSGKVKIGNGFSNWMELPYFINEDHIQLIIDNLSTTGIAGPAGDDAYEVAVTNGFVGTVTEWLLSLKGPKGDTGDQGPQGDAGADGGIGPKGDTGDQGPEGATGPAGPKGDTGDTGPAGPAGADSTVPGPQGPKGDTGDTGPQGPAGADGADYTGPTITVASSAPSSPAVGDIWIDTSA